MKVDVLNSKLFKTVDIIMLKIKFVVLSFLLVAINGYAQNLGLKHYTIDDGLPSNKVFQISFDSKGYMWISTDKGLARYNGMEFKTFTTYNGLPDNEIFGTFEDLEGRLWISNFKGVLCYYKDNVFHTVKNTPWLKIKRKSASNFFSFSMQEDSSIISGSVDGISLLIIKNQTLKEVYLEKINLQTDIDDRRSILIKKLNSNRFQLCYVHKWFIIDTLGDILETQFYKDTSYHYSIREGNKDFLGTAKNCATIDERPLYPMPQDGPIDVLFSRLVYVQDKQNIFTASKHGVYHNQTKLLDGINYTWLAHDNTGNIWVSTLNKGVFCINKNFQKSYVSDIPINDEIITSRFVGKNICLVGEDGDVYNFSDKLKTISTFPKSMIDNKEKFTKSNTYILPSGDVLNLPKTGLFYKKSNDKTYKKFNFLLNSKIELLPISKSINYIDSSFYFSMLCNQLIVKESDLFKNSTFSVTKNMVTYATNMPDRMYRSALRISDTSLWFSQSEKMSHVKNKIVTEEKKLHNNTFRQFEFYKDYLIGFTDNNKFFIYNTTSQKLDSISEPDCIWQSLYSINDSTVIINTNNSYKLLILLPALKDGTPNFRLTTVENPFIPQKADYVFGNGATYYFIKNGEISGFPAAMVAAKPMPPKPIFVSVDTKGKAYPAAALINIPYNESKTISVQIDNVSFNDKNLVTQYSISKDDNENWNTITGSEINLNAMGIGYGKYIIKLRSKTGASDFSKPAVLILQIATPFWAQWWFIGLCIVAFILLVLMIIRLIIWRQVRKRQKEFDAEMKYQQSEYKALNALMNPHFIFNSLNNIQGLINKDHKETANQYLVIFSKLIRQNMLNISKGYISLYQEMILIENYLYLEKLRFKELINFTINIDADIDTETIMIPPLLIQPLVENAIIHGLLPMQSEDSKLSIRIYEVAEVIHIEIEDNGVGLNQSLKKKTGESDSYGLSNLHRRIEHVKKFQQGNIEFEIKELLDESGKTLGTKASVTIEQL